MSGSTVSSPSAAPSASSSFDTSLRPFVFGCLLLLVALEGLGVYVTRMKEHTPDLRTYYAAGYLLRTDRAHLYDMEAQARIENERVSPAKIGLYFNHPPYEALVYAPFTLLPFVWAYRAFLIFNVLLAGACVAVARSAFSRPIEWLQPRTGFAIFLFAPLLLALAQGQDSLLFLLAICLCWREMERGNDAQAGLSLALALFRFQLALPIALLLFLRRGWRFAAGFVAGAAAVLALSVALVGVEGLKRLAHLIKLTSHAGTNDAYALVVVYPEAMANLRGLLYVCCTRWLAPQTGLAIVGVVSLVVLLLCALRMRRVASLQAGFALALLCAILLSYHLFLYDLTLLLLPLVLLAGRVPKALTLLAYLTPAIALLFLGLYWYWIAVFPVLALTACAAFGGAAGKPSHAPLPAH